MSKLEQIIFFSLLSLIFLFEGLGLPNGRDISFFLILAAPFFLFALKFVKKEPIHFPKRLISLCFLFLILSNISLVLAVNPTKSLSAYLMYIADFSLLLYSYNSLESIKKNIIYFILVFSFIFSLYSIFLNLFGRGFPHLIPLIGSQFVNARIGPHNHLGDFLVLAFVALLTSQIFKIRLNALLSFIFFLPFFIFSYSRSAYLDFVLIGAIILFMNFKNKLKMGLFNKILLVITFSASFFLFFATVKDVNFPILNEANIFLSENYNLHDKLFASHRIDYVQQGISSILAKPLFGVGPGNFYYVSLKYMQAPSGRSQLAHNIFLDIFVTNGVIAGFIFILIISFVLLKSRKDIVWLLAITVIINFQTDYTYNIYCFTALFFILLGLAYKEAEIINNK